MKNLLIILIAFLSMGLPMKAAQVQTASFRSLTTTDGLSDLLVNAIYKDSLGYVWLGTGNALERFDGVHIRHYSITGADERLKRVNAIAELPGNELWVGNGMGLWRVDKAKGVLQPVVRETIGHGVRTLLHDGNGTLFIGTERGLYVYCGGQLERVLLDANVLSAANGVNALARGEGDTLWVATDNGLYDLSLAHRKATHHPFSLHDGGRACVFGHVARIGHTLYLGTMEHGLIAFDTQARRFAPYIGVDCNVISSLSAEGTMLYVGTDGNGVHFIDTAQRKVVRSLRHEKGNPASLRSNSVYSVLVDRDGLVWVGFYQLGLDYTLYQGNLFTTYAYPPEFDSADMPVRALAIRGSERLIGTRDGLFYIDEANRRFQSYSTPEMRSNMVFSCFYHDGVYYVGTYGGGMYVLDPSTLQLRDFDPSGAMPFSKGHIFCIKADHEGTLWIGTSMGVYCYKDGRQTAHYTSANSRLPEGNVYEIYFDSSRKGWICTENGMALWEPSSRTIKSDVFPEGFIHKEKVRVVYEDSAHQLYFFPDKGTLFMSDLSMSSFRRLPPGTPMEGRNGLFVAEDAEGWLWLGTGNGLFRYDKKDRFIPYGFVDGLPSTVFTLCPPVVDADGGIWMGNAKGLVYLNTALATTGKAPAYPVEITDIRVNGASLAQPGIGDGSETRIRLSAKQDNITFLFSDFSYTDPSHTAYEYRMEGIDTDWVPLAGSSHVAYYDLPSGTRVFSVRRMGNPSSEQRVTVRIAPVAVWWMLYVAPVALLGMAFVLSRRRRKQALPPAVVETPPAPETAPAAQPEAQPVQADTKYRSVKVSPEECRRIVARLEDVMRRDKPYTHPDLKIADLAAAVGVSAHTLSYLFSQHLNRNYYDYINDYRIAEFKRLVNKDKYARYTLSALAELCGFSSRASFFRYFKKMTGITPNEYVRQIGKDNS